MSLLISRVFLLKATSARTGMSAVQDIAMSTVFFDAFDAYPTGDSATYTAMSEEFGK